MKKPQKDWGKYRIKNNLRDKNDFLFMSLALKMLLH